MWLVCEIRCSEEIKYMEFISRYSTSDWHSARQVFTCSCSSNLLLGRDPSSQCSEASGLQARGGTWESCLRNGSEDVATATTPVPKEYSPAPANIKKS